MSAHGDLKLTEIGPDLTDSQSNILPLFSGPQCI